MTRWLSSICVALVIAAAAPQARADGVALVIANQTHDRITQARGARDLVAAAAGLGAEGLTVLSGTDQRTDQMRALLGRLWTTLDPLGSPEPGPVVVVLAGHFVSSGPRVWLLGRDASAPGLAGVDGAGLSVDTVLDIVSRVPGGAVVVLARGDAAITPGPGLVAGIRGLSVPQGVLVVQGPIPAASRFLRDGLPRRGASYLSLAAEWPDLRFEGFLSPRVGLLPAIPDLPPDVTPDPHDEDSAAWAEASAAGTEAAILAYLDRFPYGLFAEEAEARLAALRLTPEAVEAALRLTVNQRRTIQSDLTRLGYSTRGVDGIFGAGTRSAIAAWQRANGLPPTQFLDADQIALIARQSAQRAAEEAEAERQRQEELARQDRAYWEATGAMGDEAGLRVYLDRYPSGEFAALANERLAVFEEEAARDRERRDRIAWQRARRLDTPEAYREYLETYPDGVSAAEARARLAELLPPEEDPAIVRARDAEAALRLGPVTSLLIEQRLASLGFPPGRIDGTFDDDTRNAIAAYQRSVRASATGYLTDAQANRLLPSPLMRLLD
jgi:peptidoglycan hydrolase-like protein with peptidoglycan-binding domain